MLGNGDFKREIELERTSIRTKAKREIRNGAGGEGGPKNLGRLTGIDLYNKPEGGGTYEKKTINVGF